MWSYLTRTKEKRLPSGVSFGALVVGHFAFSLLAALFDEPAATRNLPLFAVGWATVWMTRCTPRETAVAAVFVFFSGLAAATLGGVGFEVAIPLALVSLAEVFAGLGILQGVGRNDEENAATDWLRLIGGVGLVVPGFGALLAAFVLTRVEGAAFVPVLIGRWASEACGAIFLFTAADVLRRFLEGERPLLARMAEGMALTGSTLVLLFAVPTWMMPLMPISVLPLLVSGLRLPAMCVSSSTTMVIAATALARWTFAPVGAGVLESAVSLTTTALAALAPIALARLRDEVRRERSRIVSSENHFRDAMQNSPFGMALLRPDGVCFSVNRALCELLGYAPQDLIGLRPTDITWSERLDLVDHRLTDLATGEIDDYSVEKQFRRRDGTPIWVIVAVSAVRDPVDGRPLYFVSQLKDIEARRRAELALEQSESRWNFALESAGQGVWDYDYLRHDTFYSPMWSRMLGYEPGEISCAADAWLSLVHPHDLPHLLHEEQRHLGGTTEQFECEFRMRHKDGRWVWILDRGKVIARDQTGRPLRMIGTHTDITENRTLTEALEAEKERLRITLQSIGDGVICTDELGRITFMNPIAEQLTGWSESLALGRPCFGVFRVERDGEIGPAACPIARALATRERVSDKDGIVLVGRDGSRIDVEATASPISKPNGELLGAVLVFQDVTRSRTLQKELAQLATHDALTGLRNRSAFESALAEHCVAVAASGAVHSLCFLDLDRFKIINDTAGHAAGDALLREVGRLIREQMRRNDLVARLGGDEFGILLFGCDLDDGRLIAERLIDRIGRTRFAWDGRIYEVGASVGIARVDGETPLAADVMSRADVACYAAKAAGRNRVSIYHPSEGDARRHHAELHTAAGIRAALDTDRFVIYAQEIRDLRPSGHLQAHAELLVRMRDEHGRLLAPGAFIPAAERYGLMASVDRWMIRRVLEHFDRAILAVPRLSVSINLSANSLDDPGLPSFLAEALEQSALPPHRLRFEITETSLINNITHARRLVEDLRAAGVAIMLDDFGAGLSSFAYLEQFPADYLKIDGSFVRKLAVSPIDRAIVESINDVGHKIGAVTIAEFVEDEATLELVRAIGIDMAQGWCIGRPEPLEDLLARLSAGPSPVRSAG
ncbi:MAG: EAL domain-containing protein [Phyllobacteriaceae bacterium]|nr:EAL domain-containing protein [Phyllobacteriaceae bacterium]